MASSKFSFVPLDQRVGALCDVAPTILKVMGVDIPVEMTGESLLL